jgi:hypothetical protein
LQRCRSLDLRDPEAFRDVQAGITVIPARLSLSSRVEPHPGKDGGVMPEMAAKPARPASWQTGFITCWNAVDKERLKDMVGPGRRFPFGLPKPDNANYLSYPKRNAGVYAQMA